MHLVMLHETKQLYIIGAVMYIPGADKMLTSKEDSEVLLAYTTAMVATLIVARRYIHK